MDNRKSFPPATGPGAWRGLPAASPRPPVVAGWHQLGNGVNSFRRASVRALAMTMSPQFDPDRWDDDNMSTRSGATHATHATHGTATTRRYSGYGLARQRSRLDSVMIPEERPEYDHLKPQPLNPFDDAFFISAPRDNGLDAMDGLDPFADKNAIVSDLFPATPRPDLSQQEQQQQQQPYHVFPKRRKWLLIIIIGVAGMFSGLSSNIFFPSLDAIAKDLGVSLNEVSLTITSYLIIQGISPVFWGSLSDALGRRPIYIASFVVYLIANAALSFSPNFAVLLIFRGLQAAGSASTVSIGNGVIQDISPPSERGAFISFYQAIRNFSIAIGPVLGGLLANFFGFRSIFIFLFILSSLTLIILITFLPETMRAIAGNGSLRLSGFLYQPLIYKIKGEPEDLVDPSEPPLSKKVTLQSFVDPLRLLSDRSIFLNLVFGGVVYAIWSMVTSSTTGLFKAIFGLDELKLGLAFLPNGLGTIVGSAIIGKLMTSDYAAAEKTYKATHNLPPSHKLPAKNLPPDFPIEHARLGNLPWITTVFVASTALYGFSLSFPGMTSRPGWIVVPLTLQFLIAAASNAIFALNQTLVTDLCPGKGASSTAINNLVRCSLGAVGVALVETMLAVVGPGVAFLGLALIVVICMPLVVVNWFWGMEWRGNKARAQAVFAGYKVMEKV